jgi:hypothetical protein
MNPLADKLYHLFFFFLIILDAFDNTRKQMSVGCDFTFFEHLLQRANLEYSLVGQWSVDECV